MNDIFLHFSVWQPISFFKIVLFFHLALISLPTWRMRCEIFSPWHDYKVFFLLLRAWNTVTSLWDATSSKQTGVSCFLCRPFAAVSPGHGYDSADGHHPLWDLLSGQRRGHRQGKWCVSLQSWYGHPQPAPQACVLLLCLPNVPRAWRRLQRQLRWVNQSISSETIPERKQFG